MTRESLPNRRLTEVFSFTHGGWKLAGFPVNSGDKVAEHV
jgi:hypothetical protein